MSAVSARVRELVWERDAHTCAWCGLPVAGVHSLQHRRARGMGGTRRTDTNTPANVVLVHGTGTTGCHGWIEAHPQLAAARGFRLSQTADPAGAPIQYHTAVGPAWLLLGDDGSMTTTEGTTPVDHVRKPRNTATRENSMLLLGTGTRGIEEMERAGGHEMADPRCEVLPTKIEGGTEEDLAALGVELGEVCEDDPLFRRATLPEGWTRQPTGHDMWTDVVDTDGKKRLALFYKAAPYDRRADMAICGGAA